MNVWGVQSAGTVKCDVLMQVKVTTDVRHEHKQTSDIRTPEFQDSSLSPILEPLSKTKSFLSLDLVFLRLTSVFKLEKKRCFVFFHQRKHWTLQAKDWFHLPGRHPTHRTRLMSHSSCYTFWKQKEPLNLLSFILRWYHHWLIAKKSLWREA